MKVVGLQHEKGKLMLLGAATQQAEKGRNVGSAGGKAGSQLVRQRITDCTLSKASRSIAAAIIVEGSMFTRCLHVVYTMFTR